MNNETVMILSALAVIAAAAAGYLMARANARAAVNEDSRVLDFLQAAGYSVMYTQGAFGLVSNESRLVGKPSVDLRKAVLSVLDGEVARG